MTPAEFLDLLWELKPEPLYILIWVLQAKESHWFRDIGAAASFVEETRARTDVYVGVGLSGIDYGSGHRCKTEDVVGLAGFWADFEPQVGRAREAAPIDH